MKLKTIMEIVLSVFMVDTLLIGSNVMLVGATHAPIECGIPGAMSIGAMEDSYVTNWFPEDCNGNKGHLYAGTSLVKHHLGLPDTVSDITYLKFNLSSIPDPVEIVNTTLILRLIPIRPAGGRYCTSTENISAHHVTDNTWSESTITWNNRPEPSSTAEDTVTFFPLEIPVTERPSRYNWTVTSMVNEQLGTGSKILSIALKSDGYGCIYWDRLYDYGSNHGKQFYSKEYENGLFRPHIIVRLESSYTFGLLLAGRNLVATALATVASTVGPMLPYGGSALTYSGLVLTYSEAISTVSAIITATAEIILYSRLFSTLFATIASTELAIITSTVLTVICVKRLKQSTHAKLAKRRIRGYIGKVRSKEANF